MQLRFVSGYFGRGHNCWCSCISPGRDQGNICDAGDQTESFMGKASYLLVLSLQPQGIFLSSQSDTFGIRLICWRFKLYKFKLYKSQLGKERRPSQQQRNLRKDHRSLKFYLSQIQLIFLNLGIDINHSQLSYENYL